MFAVTSDSLDEQEEIAVDNENVDPKENWNGMKDGDWLT